MRIREFDGSGGRHKLNSITLSYTARGYNTPPIELNWNLIFSARVLQSIRKLISRIRELENFLLLAMENVDICIELVKNSCRKCFWFLQVTETQEETQYSQN